jgi:hypothetical protein
LNLPTKSASFNIQSSLSTIISSGIVTSQEMTIELWIQQSTTGYFICKRGSSTTGITFGVTGSVPLSTFQLSMQGSTECITSYNFTGSWTHFAATWSSARNQSVVYINGNLFANFPFDYFDYSVIRSWDFTGAGTFPLTFGAPSYGPYGIVGKLDNVRIWSIVRTQAQIQENILIEFSSAQAAATANLLVRKAFVIRRGYY